MERSPGSVSAAARRAIEAAERRDWSEGVPIGELLSRVNAVADKFLPMEPAHDSRVSREFTPRSFRRYQTMGCIDPPRRDGKRVVYGFGHFVQSLLVRKLLWQGMPAEMISDLVGARSAEEVKGMLLEGHQDVVAQGVLETGAVAARGGAQTWKRIVVLPGLEIHLRADLMSPSVRSVEGVMAEMELALRKLFR